MDKNYFLLFFFLGFFLICTCNNLIHCRSLKKKHLEGLEEVSHYYGGALLAGKKKNTPTTLKQIVLSSQRAAVKVL